MNKERLLLKISGGQLKSVNTDSFYDEDVLDNLIEQILTLSSQYGLGLVLGGGNIWRGKASCLPKLSNVQADYIGMLATMVNGMVLRDLLLQRGVKCRLFSALQCGRISADINPVSVEEAFANDEIVIFTAGTGLPFVTTDTAASIRAIEIGAKKILVGKEGVKGVYDKDPKLHNDAIFFPHLKYSEIIEKQLKIMDTTALTLAQEHQLKFLIFDQSQKNAFVDAIQEKIELTIIST